MAPHNVWRKQFGSRVVHWCRTCRCRRGHWLTGRNRMVVLVAGSIERVRCRECDNDRSRALRARARRLTVGILPVAAPGASKHSIRASVAWATRRARYGANGMTADGLARVRKINGLGRRKKTHCKRGHRYTERTTKITTTGARQCRLCVSWLYRQRRQAGKRWDHHRALRAERAALKRAMIAAHPDKGGTTEAFVSAHAALLRFEKQHREELVA